VTCSPIATRFVASSARADLDPSRADGRLASLGTPGRREHAVGRGRQHGAGGHGDLQGHRGRVGRIHHYEPTNAQGEVIDGGMRGSPLDDFLEMAIGIEDKDI